MFMQKTLLGFTLLAAMFNAQAHEFTAGNLQIDHAWAREMPEVAPTSAAYFVIHNKGAEADNLVAVSTPLAGKADLHEHVQNGEVMKMQHVDKVLVPAHDEVAFDPSGYHVMLMQLQRQPKAGERFPMTLTFEKAGKVEVQVVVYKDAPADKQHDHGHQH